MLKKSLSAVVAATLLLGVCNMVSATENEKSAYSFEMKSLTGGKTVDLEQYKGKVCLIVNVASRCGYTSQYEGLQKVFEKYQDKGFVVLGVPCNQFGRQEPGSSKEIAEFCSSKFSVKFPMFEKVDVNGDEACDLYKFLTSVKSEAAEPGKIKWNFEKFLVGRDGKVVGRYRSGVKPESDELTEAIEKALASKE